MRYHNGMFRGKEISSAKCITLFAPHLGRIPIKWLRKIGPEDLWENGSKLYVLLNSALNGGEWSVSCHASLSLGESAPAAL